jgi:glucosamine kinase
VRKIGRILGADMNHQSTAEAQEGLPASAGSCENLRMAVVLGIDGGGTKTRCAVARDGRVIGTATTGASNLVRGSDRDVRRSLLDGIHAACAMAKVTPDQIEAACLGVGGAAREKVVLRLREIVGEVLQCPVEIVGDMIVAYDAAMRGGAGVIVIAGTGSIAYGCDERGETARAGGWGSVISDEGSGYWIGRNAVAAAFRSLDNGRATVLIGHIMDEWQLPSREHLIAAANGKPTPNFAELAPAVFKAALEGDAIAQELLSEAGAELAKLAKVVIRRLWQRRSDVHVTAVGGVFANSSLVYKVFENSILSELPGTVVRMLMEDPVEGAIFRAEQLLATAKADEEPL